MFKLFKGYRMFRRFFWIARIMIALIALYAIFGFFTPVEGANETEETTESEDFDPNNPLGIEVKMYDDSSETGEDYTEDEDYGEEEPFVIEDPDNPEESPGGYYEPEGSGEAYDGREYNEDGNFILTEEQKEQVHEGAKEVIENGGGVVNHVDTDPIEEHNGVAVFRSSLCRDAMEEKAIISIYFKDTGTDEEYASYLLPQNNNQDRISLPAGNYEIEKVVLENVERESFYELTWDNDSSTSFEIIEDEEFELTFHVRVAAVETAQQTDPVEDLANNTDQTERNYRIALIVFGAIAAAVIVTVIVIMVKKRKENQLS